MKNYMTIKAFAALSYTAAALLLGTAPSYAAGPHSGGHGHADGNAGHGFDFGAPGKASNVTRTVDITLKENFFEPENIDVKAGETIRFRISNQGELVHEFNIGTAAMHARHQKEMMTMMEHGALEADRINHDMMKMDMGGGKTMEHNDPNSALLEPGKSAEIIWKFTKAMELEFACNVPGHYEAGMVGKMHVK
ncbi:MAG: cupredoxin family protein [Proteobacteria bacterium]|nr:cupredoxin family protein [Pseudomonadota bacterium]